MLEGLSSWFKIPCAAAICVLDMFAKAENCCPATLAAQAGPAVNIEKKKPELLTHCEKLDTACGMAFATLLETFTIIWLLFRIVSFRTETPALNNFTVKRKTEVY